MIKQLAVRMLLGQQKWYCNVLTVRGKSYMVSIKPYLSFKEIMDKAVKSEVLTAQGEFVKKADS